MSGGLLEGIALGRMQKGEQERAEKSRQDALTVSALSRKIDDPTATQQDKQDAYAKIGEIIGEKPGRPGLFNVFGKLFGHDKTASNPPATSPQQQESLNKQVPYGDPQQTYESVVARNATAMANQSGADVGLTPTPIPERETVQPTKRYGDFTNQELADKNSLEQFKRQKTILDEMDARNDARTRDRQVELARLKADEDRQKMERRFGFQMQKINEQDRLFVGRKRRELAGDYLASGRASTPEEADKLAGDQLTQLFEGKVNAQDALIELRGAQTTAIPERLDLEKQRVQQGWIRTDQGQERVDQGWDRVDQNWGRLGDNQRKRVSDLSAKAIKAEADATAYDGLKRPELANAKRQEAAGYRKEAERVASQTSSVPQRSNVPQRRSGGGGVYQGRRISRAKLPEAAKRLNMSEADAEKYIVGQGGVIY